MCSPAEVAIESVDTLYVGGPIVATDDSQPTAEAVLVRVGQDRRCRSPSPKSRNRRRGRSRPSISRSLLPGFVDLHGHVVMVGLQALAANLLPAPDGEGNDIPALQRILRDWIAKNGNVIERYGVIVGFGYDNSQLEEQRHPTRADLDSYPLSAFAVLTLKARITSTPTAPSRKLWVQSRKNAPNWSPAVNAAARFRI